MPQTPLLFLPGLLEDADAFEHQVAGLGGPSACVTADLTRNDTIAGLAEDALDQAPADRFAIAGHSMGGYVALEMLRRAPERIDRVAFLNTHARPDSPESIENRRRLMALAGRDFPAVLQQLLPHIVAPAHLAEVGITGSLTEMALATGKEAFMRQQRAIIGRIDSRPHLAQIRAKTLVVGARGDALMSPETREEMASGIPGARLAVIEDCGHMATLEQPGQVAALLAQWLRD
jgi:pimeloyl-ACP methyl ester carboxylesterase